MSENVCSCCQLFGKPPARVNFIIATGVPSKFLYRRIRHVIRHYSEKGTSMKDEDLTNHNVLKEVSDELFHLENKTNLNESTEVLKTDECCHGFLTEEVTIEDEKDQNRLEIVERHILNLLTPQEKTSDETHDFDDESPTWIIFFKSECLQPLFLNIFFRIREQKDSLYDFTLKILCFCVDEQRFFENWIFTEETIQDYNEKCPIYEKRIGQFFELLNSSIPLQKATLLFKENENLDDDRLCEILRNIFRQESSNNAATNSQWRRIMSELFRRRFRNARDIRYVRNFLQSCYQKRVEQRLKPLLWDLQRTETAMFTARKIALIVLDEFERINEEELRAYRRQLICGSDTIGRELTLYAIRLIENDRVPTVAFLYSIILTICRVASHFYFRHEFFSNTPEIFQLSIALIRQRQYHLTISGLHLCSVIIRADQNEHKYSIGYLKYDSSVARKLMDAILWLFSPFLQLQKKWRNAEDITNEKDEKKDESETKDSSLDDAERLCFRHAMVLLEKCYFRTLTGLFYGSADHCREIKTSDVHQIIEVIHVLTDKRMSRWSRGESQTRQSVHLVTDLCAFLMPIYLYGPPSVCAAITDERTLLVSLPRAIQLLVISGANPASNIEACVRFYARYIELQRKITDDSDNDEMESNEDDSSDDISVTTITGSLETSVVQPLSLDHDLISAFYRLHQSFKFSLKEEENSTQKERLKELFDTEWKKIDVLQQKNDLDRLKQENLSLTEQINKLKDELQRTQSERQQFQQETIQMGQEIERLKSTSAANTEVSVSNEMSSSVATNKTAVVQDDIINQLQDLTPNQITSEQAERCIRELNRRRTTFDDLDMRKSICGSLKHLGSDLYSSSVHFLHELIQNAEDNTYEQSIDPSLRIELSHDYILLSNNEQGLRVSNVVALCSLAVSTKTSGQKYIGEKGVGFKSVFAASNQPTLMSNSWKFYFQVPGVDAMAYITPLWLEEENIPKCILDQSLTNPQHTFLYLPLKLSARTSATEQFIDDVAAAVDPCILLNMRQLKKLEILDRRCDKSNVIEKQMIEPTKFTTTSDLTFETCRFFNLSGSIIRLKTSIGYDQFRVYTCEIDIPTYIEQRQNPKTSLTIAFPCDSTYSLNANIYTGLPVCHLGFSFMFNASFQLVTSRENVRENSQLNTFLRDHLAVLFVYLLLNDVELKKDVDRYCPSHDLHQLKHSSWWLKMIDRIYELINKYISDFFGIHAGKLIRSVNPNFIPLISNEQLYECANIQLIDSHNAFLTPERLKSLGIGFVSLKDVLECFPNRDEDSNLFRQKFSQWTKSQDERWWSLFFHHLHEGMTTEIADLMLKKPIFLLQETRRRDFLPLMNNRLLNLFIHDDLSMKMWKRQVTLLRFNSTTERKALLRSNEIQLLNDEKIIAIILKDHLQLSLSSSTTKKTIASKELIEEIWKDLLFLQSHRDQVNRTSPIVVPIQDENSFTLINNAILPTILGISIRSFIRSDTSLVIAYPYYMINGNPLTDHLLWESFFLTMNCHRSDIDVSDEFPMDKIPILPPLTMFIDSHFAQMAESILSSQTTPTLESLRQFRIAAKTKDADEELVSVSLTFDKLMVTDLEFLPRLEIPSFCRGLAIQLGIRVDYDLRTCVSILQLLSDQNISNVDLYIQWLGRLQLYVRDQYDLFDPVDFRAKCKLYLPDQNESFALEDLLVIDDQNAQRQGIAIVSKYLQLKLISPARNQCYWQFKELFRRLNCQTTISSTDICLTISKATSDKTNFFSLGDSQTILSENGLEIMIILFQFLESLIMQSVISQGRETNLYRSVIEKRNSEAPCGSREDLEWRFALLSNEIPNQLKKVAKVETDFETIPLLTIDRQLIKKRPGYVIYACFETKIIQNLARDTGKRWFILPEITRTCPVLLAACNIDYVENRSEIEWIHKNNNFEFKLSQLSRIFQETLNDNDIEVSISRYASVSVALSDIIYVDTATGDVKEEIYEYPIETNFPFWIFGKRVHLCSGDIKTPSEKAILAASALATLIHKRKYLPFDEAKTIARQKVSECNEFQSNNLSNVASTTGEIYSFSDILFPTDHHVFETMGISIGRYCRIERDSEDDSMMNVAIDRMGEHQVYLERVETQNHSQQARRTSNASNNPVVVDSLEHLRIGQNAEHFFFVYLQKLYGTNDVTPTKNWRSSTRLAIYPNCTRDLDDSAGYDFELHDTQQRFVQTRVSTTKKCYFEVKGTSGFFDEEHTPFYVSQNEHNACQQIAQNPSRQDREAYFIVIVERCHDVKEIRLGPVINWSANFNIINKEVESYRCRIRLSQPVSYLRNPTQHEHKIQHQTSYQNRTDPNQTTTNLSQSVEPKNVRSAGNQPQPTSPKVPTQKQQPETPIQASSVQPKLQQQPQISQQIPSRTLPPAPSTQPAVQQRPIRPQLSAQQQTTSNNNSEYCFFSPYPFDPRNSAYNHYFSNAYNQWVPQQHHNLGRGRGRGKNKKPNQNP